MSTTTKLRVDAGQVTGETVRSWQYIGYDECNTTLTPVGQELLAAFGKLAPGGPANRSNPRHYYVRAHHMLCTGNLQAASKWGSTNVYTEDDDGRPVHDFSVIDAMLDVWLSAGLRPFFEIGFMPRDLADPRFIESGSEYSLSPLGDYRRRGYAAPPKDYDRWYDLIHALVRHCVARYGADEVATWYWELWNEPDIMYWKGSMEEFFRLYDVTEAAVHDALPDAVFGGPATTGTEDPEGEAARYLDAFLRHVKEETNLYRGGIGTRLDFISFHTKGGIYNPSLRQDKQFPTIGTFIRNVEIGCDIIRRHGYQDLEICLSEADPDSWAAGGRYDNYNLNFRNTEYFASYVACSYERLEALARQLSMDLRPLAWTFVFDWERLFEGMRSFVTRGIHKAVFHYFELLAELGDERLSVTVSQEQDADGTMLGARAFRSGTDGMQLLVSRHHDDPDFRSTAAVDVQIDSLPFDGPAEVLRYRIDADHSNPYAEWVRQGRPDWATPEQEAAIRSRAGLEQMPTQTVPVPGGGLELSIDMPAHAVELICVRPTGGKR